jgi:hypothetical protein
LQVANIINMGIKMYNIHHVDKVEGEEVLGGIKKTLPLTADAAKEINSFHIGSFGERAVLIDDIVVGEPIDSTPQELPID